MKLLRVIALAAALVTVAACAACKQQSEEAEQSSYEKVQKALVDMDSYQSQAMVTYKSNKSESVYETLHQCRATGEYRVEVLAPEEVKGNITMFDGTNICQISPKILAKVTTAANENPERSEIFVSSFVKNYLQSHEVSISVGKFEGDKCTVLEAVIPGNHPYLATEKLWVDNKTLKPAKLVVYDPDGGERIVVVFKTFEYNVKFEDSLFTS